MHVRLHSDQSDQGPTSHGVGGTRLAEARALRAPPPLRVSSSREVSAATLPATPEAAPPGGPPSASMVSAPVAACATAAASLSGATAVAPPNRAALRRPPLNWSRASDAHPGSPPASARQTSNNAGAAILPVLVSSLPPRPSSSESTKTVSFWSVALRQSGPSRTRRRRERKVRNDPFASR